MSLDHGNVSVKKTDVQEAVTWIFRANGTLSLKAIRNDIGKGSEGSIIGHLINLSSSHIGKPPNLYAQCLQATYSQIRRERDIAEEKFTKLHLKNYALQLRFKFLTLSLKEARKETKKALTLASSAKLEMMNIEFQALAATQNLEHERDLFELHKSMMESEQKTHNKRLLWEIEELKNEIKVLNEIQKITESYRFEIAYEVGKVYSIDTKPWMKASQKLQGIIARNVIQTHLLQEELYATQAQLEKSSTENAALRQKMIDLAPVKNSLV
ncbi:hypothetical protein ACS77_02020 [Pseudomonas syringae]|uniref:Uncharacterized protein n=1 Tax=Pseudomonas syringae TaxID=317 RepID=A0A0L1MM47_PSESX|nr:hypothetical protein ACS77_02020 [Pseudomonas syringae]